MKKLIWALVGISATLFLYASAYCLSTDSFTFKNNTGKDVDDLHVEWTKAVDLDSNDKFKKSSGSGSSRADFSKGTVKDGDTCEVKVSYDGTDPEIKKWYWTIGGKKVRDEKVSDVVALATDDMNGMTVLEMITESGKITAYLPDTIWKGATIQGTVIATPNGTPGSEAKLHGMVMQVGDKKLSGMNGSFVATIAGTGGLISLLGSGGSPICSTPIPIGNTPSLPLPDPGSEPFPSPPLAQSGKPIELPGNFDPSKPINCNINGKPASVLTASPAGAVVMPSEKCVGAMEISISNGNKTGVVKGCAVDVSLRATKTNLLSGEKINIQVEVGPFENVADSQFPCRLTIENNSPANLRLEGAQNNRIEIEIRPMQLTGNHFQITLNGTGLTPGAFEINANLSPASCGAETHVFGIDKLNKGKDNKGFYVEWREDCHQGNCHKRKNHAGDHAYSWKKCGTHASKDHKDYYTTEADRDAAYEKLEKDRAVRKATNGF